MNEPSSHNTLAAEEDRREESSLLLGSDDNDDNQDVLLDLQSNPTSAMKTGRNRRRTAMMEQRRALSGRKASFRPGLGARSNTVGVLISTSTFDDVDEEEEEEDKSSSSFTRESLLHKSRNASMPSLGVSAGASSKNSYHHHLSFADAKKIWMREWRESQQKQEFSFSSFNDDLERSLRQAPSLRSIDTLVSCSNRTMSSCGGSRTTVSTVKKEEVEDVPVVVEKKRVRFTSITIQEYPIIPGCHPGGSGGIPLTIAWEPYDAVSIGIESYERWRVPHLRQRGEMRIPREHREIILRSLGFGTRTLQAAAREATLVRKQRSKSNSIEHMDKTSEQLEATIRGIQNFLTLGKKKRKERAFLARHVPSYERGASNNDNRRASTPPESLLATSTSASAYGNSSRRASTPPEVL
jgi:hypothetical protein